MNTSNLGAHDIRRVAVEAVADERTVRAFLSDRRRVRSTSAVRIAAALRALGMVVESDEVESG